MLNTLKGWFHLALSLFAQSALARTRGRLMYLRKADGPHAVTMADGTVMTRADLPPVETRRWVASRKAAVVRGVRSGLISRENALARWSLSEDEFNQWQDAVICFGEAALKVTNVKRYRQP